MDTDSETAKIKFILFAVVAFVVSGFFAYQELQYSMGAKTTDDIIERLGEASGRRGRRVPMVYYRYRDDAGMLRRDSCRIGSGFNGCEGDKVRIEYLEDTSRLAGDRNTGPLVIFFGCLAVLCVAGFLFWRHVREATRPAKPYTVPKRF